MHWAHSMLVIYSMSYFWPDCFSCSRVEKWVQCRYQRTIQKYPWSLSRDIPSSRPSSNESMLVEFPPALLIFFFRTKGVTFARKLISWWTSEKTCWSDLFFKSCSLFESHILSYLIDLVFFFSDNERWSTQRCTKEANGVGAAIRGLLCAERRRVSRIRDQENK